MNKILINGSGSSGNNLIIDSNGKKLLIDLGLDHKDILKSCDFKMDDFVAALCSHSHLDHCKSLDKFLKFGIPCYANSDVCSKYPRCNALPKIMQLGGEFTIQHFELVHNVPNNAFIIDTSDGIRILYCTDTQYIPKIVKRVNYAIIECNSDFDTIVDNAMDGDMTMSNFKEHQNINDCIEYLKRIYNVDLQQVVLWHLSSTNINPNEAVKRVRQELGFENVVYAQRGLEIELVKSEF